MWPKGGHYPTKVKALKLLWIKILCNNTENSI